MSEKLSEFLIQKATYVLVVILGFIAQGNMLVFVYDKSLYMEMDVVKLLILSFGISFITYIPNAIIIFLLYWIQKAREKENEYSLKFQFLFYSISAMVLTDVELLTYIFFKLCGMKTSISDTVFKFGGLIIIAVISLLLYKLGQYCHYKKAKKNQESNQPSND